MTHVCADHTVTGDEGTSYCARCEEEARSTYQHTVLQIGYTCSACGYFVPYGALHHCSTVPRAPYSDPTMARIAAALERIAAALEKGGALAMVAEATRDALRAALAEVDAQERKP